LSIEGFDTSIWAPGTAQATYQACARDLSSEEDRLRILDGKLTNLAAFSALSISISGGVGGSVIAGGRLALGFAIALGAVIGLAAVLLLLGVIAAFRGLSPKDFEGVTEGDAEARLTQGALERPPDEAWATFASTVVAQLVSARAANDKKAEAVTTVFRLVGCGFGVLVLAVLLTAVGAVV
jgi:hypothetical protein